MRYGKQILTVCSVIALCIAMVLHLSAPVIYEVGIAKARIQNHLQLRNRRAEGQVLTIPCAAFQSGYHLDDAELDFEGMRYDVMGYERHGDKVVCRVFADHQEQQLLDGAQKHLDKNRQAKERIRYWHPCFPAPEPYRLRLCPYKPFVAYLHPIDDSISRYDLDHYAGPPPDGGVFTANV